MKYILILINVLDKDEEMKIKLTLFSTKNLLENTSIMLVYLENIFHTVL